MLAAVNVAARYGIVGNPIPVEAYAGVDGAVEDLQMPDLR